MADVCVFKEEKLIVLWNVHALKCCCAVYERQLGYMKWINMAVLFVLLICLLMKAQGKGQGHSCFKFFFRFGADVGSLCLGQYEDADDSLLLFNAQI